MDPQQQGARERLAGRLKKELVLTTEHGDEIKLSDYEADTLADIIAEYVAAAARQTT